MIAFPGSTAYARNHGVYLTDPQVVSPLRWQHHGQLSQPRVASRSCALGSLWSWTSCRGLDLEEFPLWQQLLCSLSLLSNSNGTWTLCQALFSLTCRAYPFLLSGVRWCSPGGMLSDMYLRFSFGEHPRRAPIPGPPFLPSLTLSSAPCRVSFWTFTTGALRQRYGGVPSRTGGCHWYGGFLVGGFGDPMGKEGGIVFLPGAEPHSF